MRKATLIIMALVVSILACTSIVQAQATHIWVSGDDNQSKQCTRKALFEAFSATAVELALGSKMNGIKSSGFSGTAMNMTLKRASMFVPIPALSIKGVNVENIACIIGSSMRCSPATALLRQIKFSSPRRANTLMGSTGVRPTNGSQV